MGEKYKSLWCKIIILFTLLLQLFEPKIYNIGIDISIIFLAMIVYLRRDNFLLSLLDGIIVGIFGAELKLINTISGPIDEAIILFSYKIAIIILLYLLLKFFNKIKLDKVIKNGAILFIITFLSCMTFLIISKVIGFKMDLIRLTMIIVLPISIVNSLLVIIVPMIVNYIIKRGGDKNG